MEAVADSLLNLLYGCALGRTTDGINERLLCFRVRVLPVINMLRQVNEMNIVCPDCGRILYEDADKFECCGIDDNETGFIYLCFCGKTFVVPFEKSD